MYERSGTQSKGGSAVEAQVIVVTIEAFRTSHGITPLTIAQVIHGIDKDNLWITLQDPGEYGTVKCLPRLHVFSQYLATAAPASSHAGEALRGVETEFRHLVNDDDPDVQGMKCLYGLCQALLKYGGIQGGIAWQAGPRRLDMEVVDRPIPCIQLAISTPVNIVAVASG